MPRVLIDSRKGGGVITLRTVSCVLMGKVNNATARAVCKTQPGLPHSRLWRGRTPIAENQLTFKTGLSWQALCWAKRQLSSARPKDLEKTASRCFRSMRTEDTSTWWMLTSNLMFSQVEDSPYSQRGYVRSCLEMSLLQVRRSQMLLWEQSHWLSGAALDAKRLEAGAE